MLDLNLTPVIDVAIGLVFVLLVLSFFISTLKELIATFLGLRAQHLLNILQNMLEPSKYDELDGVARIKDDFADASSALGKFSSNPTRAAFEHPIVQSLMQGKKLHAGPFGKRFNGPSFISSRDFANVIVSTLSEEPTLTTLQPVIDQLSAVLPDPAQEIIQQAIESSLDDITVFLTQLRLGAEDLDPDDVTRRALLALLSALEGQHPSDLAFASLRQNLDQIDNPALKAILESMMTSAQARVVEGESQLVVVRENLEAWFDSTMDRATGWYKRRMARIGLIISAFVVIGFNVDAIGITRALWWDNALREVLVAQSISYIESGDTESEDAEQTTISLNELNRIGVPLFWSGVWVPEDAYGNPDQFVNPRDFPSGVQGWLVKLLGWTTAIIAGSQGSHIWYDLLKHLVNLRGGGIKPEPATK